MPLYNNEKLVEESISSVLMQDYSYWELIIVDDCSKDNSYIVAKKYESEKIKIFKNTSNQGVSFSRNFAIKQASGRYIAFLDSDDLWEPQKLRLQIHAMHENDATISYTDYFKIDYDGKLRGIVKTPKQVDYHTLLKSNYMGCLTVMYDKMKIDQVFFPQYKKSEDYLLWLSILKNSRVAIGINIPLAKYRISKKSRSSNKVDAVICQWKIYYSKEKLGFCKSCKYFLHYLIIGIFRYSI